ncbi:MAG: leucine--tRNA ligase [Acidimicrobiia bacterium]|nr:leucine--tRNA ligase [Acidimicrobiia bacterium]NNF11513.1 leucine--tRNA ligase [Acidimicrobiia bacterium]NNL71057.1 leucine--tRNA ligase [Acidimicrobiia bacterium]
MPYDHRAIEQKWQQQWAADGLYRSRVDWDKPKHYALTMLPYPSGELHMGHWYAVAPSDARARYMRMKGYNVLFPMGFDAFGLPAENAAIQRGIHPPTWTYANIDRMRAGFKAMGTMFDWEREAVSCDPSYYRWSQWFFKKLLEAGLAYRGEAVVNWSPTLQTVLANEQVIDGKDERTGQPVVQKTMAQWFYAMTKYAQELLNYDGLDWPDPVRLMQTNWIGRSEGADVVFTTEHGDELEVFTTRPDTLWGATFMVLAPEHPLVDSLTTDDQRAEVAAYKEATARRSEVERMEAERDKTGVFTGGYAINPVNDARIPVWIADYVLLTYGSGAIMAVPAHDQRDFEFARQFGLTIAPVIQPSGEAPLQEPEMTEAYVGPGTMVDSGPITGIETNTEKGRKNPSIAATIDWLEENSRGREAVNYRVRDWLISRQRYWGSPIPVVYQDSGDYEVVPDEDLPVVLPDDVDFQQGSGNPLNWHEGFLNTVDSEGEPARRETDTLDTFMCSSWYQLRYLSPDNEDAPFDPDEAAYWLPVDVYTGGSEHATLHLLYTRFFTKALRDMGLYDDTAEAMRRHGRDPDGLFDEPMLLYRSQGQILGEERAGDTVVVDGVRQDGRVVADRVTVNPSAGPGDGLAVGEIVRRTENVLQVAAGEEIVTVEVPDTATVEIPGIPGENDVNQLKHHLEVQRMSKSRGNVVDPNDLVEQYGADTVRTYLMFAYDWEKGGPWDSRGIVGARRFLDDVWKLATTEYAADSPDGESSASLRRLVHQTRAKVDRDMAAFKWNTAVAALMGLRNELQSIARDGSVDPDAWTEAVESLLLLLAPIAPFITEELWRARGNDGSVHVQSWPEADADLARELSVTMVVQVNGKVRDRVEVPADIAEDEAIDRAMASERVQTYLEGGEPKKVIARPPKLVNIVV